MKVKALDFVMTPRGSFALVRETVRNGEEAAIEFIGLKADRGKEKSAWWNADDLAVIDDLPHVLARSIAHPFGQGVRELNARRAKPVLEER